MSSLGQLDRKTVVINSTFRDMGTPSSFMWKFSERVEGIRYADLRMFTVENGLYNVDSTNNTFYLSENWTLPSAVWTYSLLPVTIPTGYYDDVTFASTLGLAMSNASLNNGGNLYLVQILNSGILQISLASASTTSNGTFAIGFTNGTTTWQPTAQLLGFTTLTINAYSSLTSGLYQTITSNTPTALVVYDYLLVNSQKLGNDVSFYSGRYSSSTQIGTDTPIKPSPSSCWAVVPNNQPSRDNNVLIWENVRPPQIATLKYPYSLDYIDINILDKFGVNVDLSGQSVTLVVELYTDKKGQDVSTTTQRSC
jgi:hypothetical protein